MAKVDITAAFALAAFINHVFPIIKPDDCGPRSIFPPENKTQSTLYLFVNMFKFDTGGNLAAASTMTGIFLIY